MRASRKKAYQGLPVKDAVQYITTCDKVVTNLFIL
jgi:hypothetical protein